MTTVARENQSSRITKNNSPSTTEVHYHFLSPTLQLDLDRASEEIDPPTTNVAIHYRVLKTHLANKWGPNSVKDSNEATSKLALLRVDERGADVYLAAVFSIIDLLTKTPIRDAANNPIMEAVPPRPRTCCVYRRGRSRQKPLGTTTSKQQSQKPPPHRRPHQEHGHPRTRGIQLYALLKPRRPVPTS